MLPIVAMILSTSAGISHTCCQVGNYCCCYDGLLLLFLAMPTGLLITVAIIVLVIEAAHAVAWKSAQEPSCPQINFASQRLCLESEDFLCRHCTIQA